MIEIWNSCFGLLSSRNFATMAMWRNDFSSLYSWIQYDVWNLTLKRRLSCYNLTFLTSFTFRQSVWARCIASEWELLFRVGKVLWFVQIHRINLSAAEPKMHNRESAVSHFLSAERHFVVVFFIAFTDNNFCSLVDCEWYLSCCKVITRS